MSNRRRVLAEVLSIDAWHEPMKFDGKSFKVHVELSFRQGRVGGDDPEFPFTFNISLKRALLTLTIETPLVINRSSVARSIPANQAELTRITTARNEVKNNAEIGGKVSPSSMSVAMSGKVSGSQNKTNENQMKFVQDVPRIVAYPHPSGSNEYSWELKPGQTETLEGQPWDPVKEPRFSVKSNVIGNPTIDPIIKAIVSCKLEDIEITELTLKNATFVGQLKELAFHKATRQQQSSILNLRSGKWS